ncbi:MAG: hypothetical protein H6R18_1511 [Proteobacteria bacterium]|nr:hypothetical protein [Pseudomonadota bacterium]
MKITRLVLLLLALVPGLASATDVGLVGVMGSKALLSINGSEPVPVAAGQSSQGVRVISVQGQQTIVEVDGKRRTLRVGQQVGGNAAAETGGASGSGSSTAILKADGAGHFFTTGAINGAAVRFMVDTGATFISIGAAEAKRIGLSPAGGQRGMSHTANGLTEVTKIKLGTVRVGEVTLHNIDAVIHGNDLPVTLLGMSFLNRMEMQREGSTMTLKKRF